MSIKALKFLVLTPQTINQRLPLSHTPVLNTTLYLRMKSFSSVIALAFAVVTIASPVPQLPGLPLLGPVLDPVLGSVPVVGSATGPVGGAASGLTSGLPLAAAPGVGGLRSRAAEEVPALGEIPGPIVPTIPVIPGPEPSGIVPL